MSRITFRKIDQKEALIYHDGELVGELFRDENLLTGRPVYLILLSEDWRSWLRVEDRSKVRDCIRQRLRTHPLLGWRY
ncbi:MAG: hypothetical protein OXN16_12645 [Gammaproteobacteria bacterium]|nr:hypothetical protein [Gammaproteobacteria bacterium]